MRSFSGSLVTILKNVEEQAERLNDLKVVIDGNTFKRIDTKSYPGVAIREMVMNAVCHADYFIRSNIKIEFFPDKVKITSPGGIFDASLDDIMNGVQTYRNPRLVHIFDKLGMIENFGTGIPRTMYSYKDYDVKPEFKVTDNFFIVTLPNVNYLGDQINDIGLEILKAIKQHPGIKVPEIVNILYEVDPSITADKVRNSIKRNLTKYVEHKGSNKTGGYYLIKKIAFENKHLMIYIKFIEKMIKKKSKGGVKIMKIAVVQASSQISKNNMLYSYTKKYAKDADVINFGCFLDDEEKYSYIEISILIGMLIDENVVDFVVTGCSSGQGMMLACNSMPGVLCGYAPTPKDAYLFAQINNGNAISLPLGEQYTYIGEENLEMTLKALFSEPFGGGYPASEAQRKIADSKMLKEIRAKSQRELKEFLSEIDPLLIEKLNRKIKAVLS